MNRPDISLIVNTYQKPRHLALVLESIALQEGVDGRFEVVVADDGSEAPTVEIIADFARLEAAGQLVVEETVVEGLEAMPKSFVDMLSGANTGKMLVRL